MRAPLASPEFGCFNSVDKGTHGMNFSTLLKVFDTVMAVRGTRKEERAEEPSSAAEVRQPAPTFGEQLETRLTNVVVAALKEAFDRDRTRLELERAQVDEQRRRTEEMIRIELRRQAADRELGRLRLLAAVALVGWIASLVLLTTRLSHMSASSRGVLIAGFLLLLGSIAASFLGQSRIGTCMSETDTPPESGPAGNAALLLLVAGMAISAIGLLL
jgi:hypothetical protein